MAHIKNLWVKLECAEDSTLIVDIALKPSGRAQTEVPIPRKFFDAIMSLAQSAADQHEAQMRAEILGDELTQQPNKE